MSGKTKLRTLWTFFTGGIPEPDFVQKSSDGGLAHFQSGKSAGRNQDDKTDNTTVKCEVLAIDVPCWRCKKQSAAIVGIMRTDARSSGLFDCFIPFEACAELILPMLSDEILAKKNVGKLKLRFSKTVNKSYVSNGCRHCDVIFGNHPLTESLREYFNDMDDQDYSKVPSIATIRIPEEIINELEAW
jgi:hypothetical protein